MESHIRIKFTASLTALQDLEPYAYKTLMYLATRSDHLGVCYPAPKTIAEHIGISVDTVYDKLQELFTFGYARLLRNAFYDRLTKKSSPAVFQVSPHFLEIAEKFFSESMSLWDSGFQNRVKPESNQQQEQASEQTAFNQPQETTTTTNNRDSEKERANRKPPKQEQPQQRKQTKQAQAEKSESSAIVKKYTNPILIDHELEALQESLAQNLVGLGIKVLMARGFITEYGYESCNIAYHNLRYLTTRQTIDNPSGFYRYLLQNHLADAMPPAKKPHITDDIDIDDYMDS